MSHGGIEASEFVKCFFGASNRKIFLLVAPGFKPDWNYVAKIFAATSNSISTYIVVEKRPGNSNGFNASVQKSTEDLTSISSCTSLEFLNLFDDQNALTGGRTIVTRLQEISFDDFTDIVIDLSWLSIGTSFPIVRYFFMHAERICNSPNVHLFVSYSHNYENWVLEEPNDAATYVHSFIDRSTHLDTSSKVTRLWLPLLSLGRKGVIDLLYKFVDPDDTCPILPFPSNNPRLVDQLLDEFGEEIVETWDIDSSNFVYASDADPLDIYRTVLRLADLRKSVFNETGGSMLVLSPLGNKIIALGILMAALEQDLPIVHVETMGYQLNSNLSTSTVDPTLVHVWLTGEAYP